MQDFPSTFAAVMDVVFGVALFWNLRVHTFGGAVIRALALTLSIALLSALLVIPFGSI